MDSHAASTSSAAQPAKQAAARGTSRPAARRARPGAAKPRRRIIMQTSLGLVEAIHGPDLTWPDGETTVEFIAGVVRATG